jgi:hypothetical protein
MTSGARYDGVPLEKVVVRNLPEVVSEHEPKSAIFHSLIPRSTIPLDSPHTVI